MVIPLNHDFRALPKLLEHSGEILRHLRLGHVHLRHTFDHSFSEMDRHGPLDVEIQKQ